GAQGVRADTAAAECEHQRAVPRADPDGQGLQGPDPDDRSGDAVPDRFAGALSQGFGHHQERGADHTAGSPDPTGEAIATARRKEVIRAWTRAARLAAGIAAIVPLTGCITVKAPDKPIDVNL